jgi:hypothetical protein
MVDLVPVRYVADVQEIAHDVRQEVARAVGPNLDHAVAAAIQRARPEPAFADVDLGREQIRRGH